MATLAMGALPLWPGAAERLAALEVQLASPEPADVSRPDLADDHALWVRLLAWAEAADGWHPDSAYGVLVAVRCWGATLAADARSGYRITWEQYGGDVPAARRELQPHTAQLSGWLRQLPTRE